MVEYRFAVIDFKGQGTHSSSVYLMAISSDLGIVRKRATRTELRIR